MPTRNEEFLGKIALITGAGAGIGRAIALEWSRRGGIAVVTDIQEGDAERVKSEIEAEGGSAFARKLDVCALDEIKAGIAASVEHGGGIDALFNVAGTNLAKNVEETDDEDWSRILDTNLTSVYRCSKYALPELRKRRGSIVNIASVAGLIGEGRCAAYSASKGGVVLLTRNMAMDFAADGVRVNAICPAGAMTPRIEGYMRSVPGLEREMLQMRPIGRFAESKEIARPALFLASTDASYITGSILVVDGGLTAGFRVPVLDKMK
ncbi:MAG: glucose 1-dehydrogenase [Alphaproteobacteria bacterium]|nr:glucose 1-dehydrogenase [Alphaproteobacteria bacterium]